MRLTCGMSGYQYSFVMDLTSPCGVFVCHDLKNATCFYILRLNGKAKNLGILNISNKTLEST
jgi:hypothetical protein